MTCPKCGIELEDGKLLCENCGEEVKIVPDFDIEFETKLSESINSMLEDITEDDLMSDDIEDDIVDEFKEYFKPKPIDFHKHGKIFVIAMAFILVAAVTFAGVSVINNKRDNSYDYQFNKAVAYANENNYADAVVHMERALAINSDNAQASVMLARYYDKNNQSQSAVSVLKEIINLETDIKTKDEAYDLLLTILNAQKKYADMGHVLKDCNVLRIISKYNKYASLEPDFNKLGGVYDEIISITLTGNTQGFVYYTLDGSLPTQNSMVYETPILLETGEYTIKAMFVNMYGVESDIVTQNFYINLSEPEPPVVNFDSGNYQEPGLISVIHDNDTRVYYTTDGSVPDKNSERYTRPIEMPYGISNFSFVAINSSGLSSEIVYRSYQLNIEANFDKDLALQVLINNLWANGKLKDLDGHVPNKLGKNQYTISTVADISDVRYYIVTEEYIDTTGEIHSTNNMYAIDVSTADLYEAYKYDEGKYTIRHIETKK